jgi:hypothetical protein
MTDRDQSHIVIAGGSGFLGRGLAREMRRVPPDLAPSTGAMTFHSPKARHHLRRITDSSAELHSRT